MVDFITFTPPTPIDHLTPLTEQHDQKHIIYAHKNSDYSAFHEQLKAKYQAFFIDRKPLLHAISYSFNSWLFNGAYDLRCQLPYNNVFYTLTKQQNAAMVRNTYLSLIDISLVQSYLNILKRERFLTTSISV